MSKRIDRFLEELEYQYPDEKLLYPTDLKDAIICTVEMFAGSDGVPAYATLIDGIYDSEN